MLHVVIIACFVFAQRSLDKRTQKVKDTELDVVGIERTIASTGDLPTTWQSYFTMDGCALLLLLNHNTITCLLRLCSVWCSRD